VLAPDTGYVFSNKERKLPVRLESGLRTDSVVIQPPAGFAIDELPVPIEIDSPYGVYHALWEIGNGSVTFQQSLDCRLRESQKLLRQSGQRPEPPVIPMKH